MWHTNVERRIIAYTAMQSRSHYSDDDDNDDIFSTLFLSRVFMIFMLYNEENNEILK